MPEGSRRWMTLARVVFLVAAGLFIWAGLRDQGDDLRTGLGDTPRGGLVASFVLVVIGLLVTGFLWRRVLATFGHPIPIRPGLAIFFFGQLGKYIPGSVWSFGAQAEGGRRFAIPARVTVGASSVFLGLHVATAAVVGGVIGLLPSTDSSISSGWCLLIAAVGLVSLLPLVVRSLATRVAGKPPEIHWRDQLELVATMLAAWGAYALSVVLLRPSASGQDLSALVMAYALAYAAGVVVILAPAGLGAREGVFVLIAGPAVGTGVAAALALVTRVVTTVADVALAAATTALDRGQHRRADS